MNINILVMLLLTSLVGFYSWKSFLRKDDSAPSQLPWVPIDVNKRRSFVNQTRDAGMFTERQRRVAIIGVNSCGVDMKPPSQKHFNNGVMETFLTGICAVTKVSVIPPIPPTPPSPSFGWDVIVEGNYTDNGGQYFIVEGNGDGLIIDGNSGPNVTNSQVIIENSDASPSFFDFMFDGVGWDWGAILDGNVF
jgi:hypothetical protein